MSHEHGKPTFRAGLSLTPEALNVALAKVGWKHGILRSCLSCDNFTEATETCRLYNARPPARVIAFGCGAYSDDMDVPF